MNSERPKVKQGKPALPKISINPKWQASTGNEDMQLVKWGPKDFTGFSIAAEEIHADDLEALDGWADDEA